MGRMTWLQLRSGTARSIALLLGMLLATTAFTVLTAASRTAQLRTIGTVSAHFVPAYDILVRPKGARTRLETQTGTVQPNFLSGIYGGITMGQYHQIAAIPGVSVAAPVAMVGYAVLPEVQRPTPIPAADYRQRHRQLYRVSTTWVSAGGSSKDAQPPSYIYITPNRLSTNAQTQSSTEILPDGKRVTACPQPPAAALAAASPFSVAAQSSTVCSSTANGLGPGPQGSDNKPQNPGFSAPWEVPVLIAAIDPTAEAKLDGLNHALVSGSYLPENATSHQQGEPAITAFPVLASSASGMDEYAVTRLEKLPTPQSPPVMTAAWRTRENKVPGQTLVTTQTTAQQAFSHVLQTMSDKHGPRLAVFQYWNVGPVSYRRAADSALAAVTVHNPASAWHSGFGISPPMDNADVQYRKLTDHAPATNVYTGSVPSPQLVGVFDPAKVTAFDPLSEVPLGIYQPTAASPATPASRAALGGSDLLPSLNLGGYVSQPVNLITTLSALPALESKLFTGNLHTLDPISVIRVRVAGVTGPNPVSLERIREVAQQIEQRTHLTVDIVAGSSPVPTTIDLPTGKFGQPSLTLSEDWVKKGVAVSIITAIDKNSVVLFTLILIVCVLFVANSATAAVRGRRRELGVLACLGWTKPRIFAAALGEIAAIALAAGILGGAAALPLTSALGLRASPGRAALAVPIAVGVGVVAGAIPAWLAARADPVASVRPPVLGVRRARHPGGITALAAVNVLRTPGRSLVGAVSLAIGITALTMLTAVSVAFRGDVVGSLLGNAVAVQVRGVDYIATVATVALGVLAIGDVVFLNIRERAGELATLRALGWQESALSRLVVTEGALIGIAGAVLGAALGLAATAKFTGQVPVALCGVAVVAALAGAAITAVSALLPARALRRLPAAHLLAED